MVSFLERKAVLTGKACGRGIALFPLVIYFTRGSVYMSVLVSQFVLPSPPLFPLSTIPFSKSASVFLS